MAENSVEGLVKEQQDAAKRIERAQLQKERYIHEEENLEEQIKSGYITEDEAHKRFARQMMRQKQEGDKHIDSVVAAGADYQTTEQMIEEALDNESKLPFVIWLKRVTRYKHFERAAKKEQTRRKSKTFKHPCPLLQTFIHSAFFEAALCTVLFANAYTISETVSRSVKENQEGVFYILEHIFTGVFTVELLLRFAVDGWIWIYDRYHVADLMLIIVTGIIPLWILGPVGAKSSAMRAFQVLRVCRLMRLIYLVRNWFVIFWSLLQGMLQSGRTVAWTFMLICTILFVFGVFGVYWIGRSHTFKDDEIAAIYFATFPKAFVTLFQVTTFDDWTSLCRYLMSKSTWTILFFLAFILIVPVTLLNLITAVMVANAFQAASEDEDAIAQQKSTQTKKEIDMLKSIFVEIDVNGDGTLSKQEFDDAVSNNQAIQEQFEILQISMDDVEEIWNLLDTGLGEITVEQFAEGLQAIQNEAKAKDSFSIVKRTQKLNRRLEMLAGKIEKQLDFAASLRTEATTVHRQMGGVLVELHDFVELLTPCIPNGAVTRNTEDLDAFYERLNRKAAESAQETTITTNASMFQKHGNSRTGPTPAAN